MNRVLHVLQPTEEQAVYQRYAAASLATQPALCCAVQYAPELLAVIPQEVLDRDYGCGDPTPFVRVGETVLDLGSGGGKLCFIAAQLVGEQGRVIGVDCNASMHALARSAAPIVAQKLGYANVDFRYGLIQDLRLDLGLLEQHLADQPVQDLAGYLALRSLQERLRAEQPLIADESVDCVLSNCVLNLVRLADRQQLFQEVFRVLRHGGRAAISDIVADQDVPEALQRDPELWSGCISGAFREDQFLREFEQAGFHGLQIAKRDSQPWKVVDGISFRSITVVAHKAANRQQLDCQQSVIYKGPFKRVEDDHGQQFLRGQQMPVCGRTFDLLQQAPYAEMFLPIDSGSSLPRGQAEAVDLMRHS